jgi:hypothetical protein
MGGNRTSGGKPPLAVDAIRGSGRYADFGFAKKSGPNSLSPVAGSIDKVSHSFFAINQPGRPSGQTA